MDSQIKKILLEADALEGTLERPSGWTLQHHLAMLSEINLIATDIEMHFESVYANVRENYHGASVATVYLEKLSETIREEDRFFNTITFSSFNRLVLISKRYSLPAVAAWFHPYTTRAPQFHIHTK